jgi:glutathione S-transferase
MLERTADIGVLYPIARIVHATKSPLGLPPNPGMEKHFREALPPALAYLDDEMADGRSFVAGASPTVADCTLQAAFQFGRFGGVELDPTYQNLTRWDQAYREREAAKSVLLT